MLLCTKRKALKEFKPITIDATESEELKSILNEIDVLKKLSSKNEYVINYLDSFSIDVARYRMYHIVTNIYEVRYLNFISLLEPKDPVFSTRYYLRF
jgi:serine/threonine protein kinase